MGRLGRGTKHGAAQPHLLECARGLSMFEDEPDPSTMPWPKQAEKTRREYVERRVNEWKDAGKLNPRHSLAARLLDDLTKEAIKIIKEDDRYREADLDQKLSDADSLVFDLMHAAMSYENDYAKREEPNFWRHAAQPVYEIKNKSYRLMFKGEVESAADRYLSQPLRSQLYDRTLVDMLLGLELYLFADEMIHPIKIPGLPANSPLKQPHPLWTAFSSIAVATLVLGGIIWLTGSAMSGDRIGDWGGWVVGLCILLWIINALWTVIALPFVWKRHFAARKKALGILDAMLSTYAQMQSDSLISARHVLDSVNGSAAQGVVWPSPIFVLLEDVIARGGRL